MSGYYVEKEKLPEHLRGLAETLNRDSAEERVSDEEYAAVGFLLLRVADGDREALKKVASFVQSQQSRLKSIAQRHNEGRREVLNWLRWAENWTQRKFDTA